MLEHAHHLRVHPTPEWKCSMHFHIRPANRAKREGIFIFTDRVIQWAQAMQCMRRELKSQWFDRIAYLASVHRRIKTAEKLLIRI